MKKLLTLFCLALLVPAAWAKQVPQSDAQKCAVTFYRLNNLSGITDPQVQSVTAKSWEDIPSLYIFRFVTGGFVLVAADDAAIPILGYSFENDMPETIDNPAVNDWLDNYSREIGYICSNKLDNTETLKEWNSIQESPTVVPGGDTGPLLATLWDQGCYYNAICPADDAGPCGHVLTGCVATAMAQIMKYHNFPAQGVGENTYVDPVYGPQSANFENTTYDWSSMPDSATGNNSAIATIMDHSGVSVNMQYGPTWSGAYDYSVPIALQDYFNYSPDIEIKYKDNYANLEDFENLLRADLDLQLPVCYSGFGPGGGHEFVVDGYRLIDGTRMREIIFHFNWGWSGIANGYYLIGNLNPGPYTFDNNNAAVVHIKPYNPDLIVRITNPVTQSVVNVGDNVEIKAKVVRGSANVMKIFIDSVEKFSTTGDSISFIWNISGSDLGSHIVKAYAISDTDTVYYKTLLNVAEWISQATGFQTPNRAVTYLSALDSNIVWATASNASNINGPSSDFARTLDGGNTWTSGAIPNTTGLRSAMIFAINANKAYVAMARITGSKPMGIFVTTDGGVTWLRQSTASFSNPASYPDVVHFFNSDDGVAIGDPVNNEYEIYTTTNGGTNWTAVPGANIPDPQPGEYAIVGYYSAVHDTLWAGTSQGRIFKSTDKGHHWTVSAPAILAGKDVKPVFRDGSHGLAMDELSGTGLLCETSDGGTTWTQVNYAGPLYGYELDYVPGTPNTYVKSSYIGANLGAAYSFDGGHSWTEFIGTNGIKYFQMAWVNDHCGWSGGINTSPTEGGVHKFIGLLQVTLPAPRNTAASANLHDVIINWNEPAYDPTQLTLLGYNITRNSEKINDSLITGLGYTEENVPAGQNTYCISAQYNAGESQGSCIEVDVAVGVANPGDQPVLVIYPNPAHGRIMVQAASPSAEILIYDQTGKTMPVAAKNLHSGLFTIDISGLSSGIYVVSAINAEGLSRSKLVVY